MFLGTRLTAPGGVQCSTQCAIILVKARACLLGWQVTPKLLQYYASMATGKGQCGSGDNEMPTFCAYNFPAVVLTVGRDNWVHLEEAYSELLKDIQWKVRRTLSFSIHEIALILGPKLTQDSLLPAFDTFLKDLDEVKVGVLQNLAKLLGVLEPAARQQYVPLLCNLEMESDNWRFRQLLALQLGELFHLYDEVKQDVPKPETRNPTPENPKPETRKGVVCMK
jgi:serine/threonine-protein phosphatase 4 regulatory subunit 1